MGGVGGKAFTKDQCGNRLVIGDGMCEPRHWLVPIFPGGQPTVAAVRVTAHSITASPPGTQLPPWGDEFCLPHVPAGPHLSGGGQALAPTLDLDCSLTTLRRVFNPQFLHLHNGMMVTAMRAGVFF